MRTNIKLSLCSLALLWAHAVLNAQTNTSYGHNAGNAGQRNSIFGSYAGQVVTGSDNTFLGYRAGHRNTTGHGNTFTGEDSGHANTTGHYNTFSGNNAGFYNTTGRNNTFLGSLSGQHNTIGFNNTFLGTYSGNLNTTGNYNTFVGTSSGRSSTTGFFNIFSGYQSGEYNTTGFQNTFLGGHSGRNNTTGADNTFSGFGAGYSNRTGVNNTFSGVRSGFTNSVGEQNTFYGANSGYNNTVGSHNIYLGYNSGYSNTEGSNNVFLGHEAGYDETGSDKLYIANARDNTLVYGDFATGSIGVGTKNLGSYRLTVNGNVRAKEVVVESGWSDFVFEPGYDLPTLSEVEAHIAAKGHLQDIPSAAEVAEHGISLGEMDAKLLQKVEELMLYTIEQEKRMQEQQKQIEGLKAQLEKFSNGTLQNLNARN